MRWSRGPSGPGWLLAVLVLVASTLPVGASEPGADEAPPVLTLGALVPDPSLAPGVALVQLTSPSYDAAADAYFATLADLGAARDGLTAALARLDELEVERAEARERLAELELERAAVVAELDVLWTSLRRVAVSAFVGAADDSALAMTASDAGAVVDAQRRVELGDRATTRHLEQIDELSGRLAALDEDLDALSGHLTELADDALDTGDDAENLRIDSFVLSIELGERADDVRAERRLASVVGADFPLVALDAYVAAAATMGEIDPGCRLEWWMLAGVGWVESGHGTAHGSVLAETGRTTREIFGIPLDGTNGTALIADSDGGRLDGDPGIDRAVGPMQFIPQSWDYYGRDGDGDGATDPHNLYDAALAAGTLLCDAGGDLGTDGGRRTAYFSYNRSEAYVDKVLTRAFHYRDRVRVPDAPAPV